MNMTIFGQRQIKQLKIWEIVKQRLLGVEIDQSLNFDKQVSSLYEKAGKKSYSAIVQFYELTQGLILLKIFIESQFGCPLDVPW